MTGEAIATLPVRVRVLVDLGARVEAEPIEIAVCSVQAPLTPDERPWGVDVVAATIDGLGKLLWLLTAGQAGDVADREGQAADGERPGSPGPARYTPAKVISVVVDDLFPPLIMSRERVAAINWLREQFRHLAERVAGTVAPGELPRVLEPLRTACAHAEQVIETARVPLGWFEAQLAHLDAAPPADAGAAVPTGVGAADATSNPAGGPVGTGEAQAGEPGGGA